MSPTSSSTSTRPPSPPGPDAQAWVDRVDALLAKAASTEFPEEAEALLTKAQQLMSRHLIDEAMLTAAGAPARSRIGSDTIVIAAPYVTAKSALLGAVASTNDCRVVLQRGPSGSRTCVVMGHDEDLAATRTLFGALSVHAVRTMLATPVPGHDTARRFRHAFLLAFAGRIGERLRAARAEVQREVRRTRGTGVDVVLAGRLAEVDAAFAEAFPRTRASRASHSSSAGVLSGRRAAETASLGGPRLPGSGRGLPSG
jgi:hypothetical protein